MDKVFTALLSPLGTALALMVLAAGLGWSAAGRRRWTRAAWTLGAAAWLWLGVWSLPVASHALRRAVEAPYPPVPVQALEKAQAIVVLGGGIRPAEVAGQPPDLGQAADRMWHAARLFHAGKAPLVVLSGGHSPQDSAESEAQAMQRFMVDLGVPAAAMRLEERSRNTRQNAQFTAEMLRAQGVQHVLLVTSALHMRRARALFEAQGLTVTPAATDHEARTRFSAPAETWLPNTDALDGSARAMKELVGAWVGR